MKVTTIRLGTDLWRLLEHEAEQAGVSVSQFIREAALARACAAVASRGEDPFALLAGATQSDGEPSDPAITRAAAANARARAAETYQEAEALRAESVMARHHALEVSERAARKTRRAPTPLTAERTDD